MKQPLNSVVKYNLIEVRDIEMSKIVISKQNARKDLSTVNEEANLDDLANSIMEKGLLSPITVIQKGNVYELIVGQKEIAKMLGISERSIRRSTQAV